jgi:transcriptional regulator with XRE-family HTH domain
MRPRCFHWKTTPLETPRVLPAAVKPPSRSIALGVEFMQQVYSTCTFKSTHDAPVFLDVYVPLPMDIGSRLKESRISAKLTQEAVGRAFSTNEKPEGFGKGTVSAWELGRNEPTASQLIRLCELYRVSADYLLFGKSSSLESNESWLLDAYRSAAPTGRQMIESSAAASLILGSTAGQEIDMRSATTMR